MAAIYKVKYRIRKLKGNSIHNMYIITNTNFIYIYIYI